MVYIGSIQSTNIEFVCGLLVYLGAVVQSSMSWGFFLHIFYSTVDIYSVEQMSSLCWKRSFGNFVQDFGFKILQRIVLYMLEHYGKMIL